MLRASDGRPVHLPPSAARYTTSRHLQRELDIVDRATSTNHRNHHVVVVDTRTVEGLDASRAAAVTTMLTEPVTEPRPVITVAGTGKTRMLAAAVHGWHSAGVPVFGVGPSASGRKATRDRCRHGGGHVARDGTTDDP